MDGRSAGWIQISESKLTLHREQRRCIYVKEISVCCHQLRMAGCGMKMNILRDCRKNRACGGDNAIQFTDILNWLLLYEYYCTRVSVHYCKTFRCNCK